MQLAYYVAPWDRDDTPAEVWAPAPDDVHTLRHGYNLADLQRLSRLAMGRVVGGSLDYRTRQEVAWSAIAEALYAAEQAPEPGELIGIGQAAIGAHVSDDMRHHGRDTSHPGQERPRFAAYWAGLSPHTPSPEPRIVDATALWQIWPRLTDRQREALLALAACDDYTLAAQSLGMSYPSFCTQIWNARHRFLELWHEGEEPSQLWGADRRTWRHNVAGEPIEHRPVTVRHRAARRVSPRRTTKEIPHGLRGYKRYKCQCDICCAASREAGRKRARSKGIPERKPAVTDEQLAKARALKAAGRSIRSIAAELGVGDTTLGWNLRNRARTAGVEVPS